MPIKEDHPVLNTPQDNISIWRYMDIPSFIALLVNKSLTFVRFDLFEDGYEGKLPKMTALAIDANIRQKIKKGKLLPKYWNLSEILNNGIRDTYINCWCKENHEMVHMWKIYSKENGVAIQTDYKNLKQSVNTEETVYPSEVSYVDFDNDIVNWKSNTLSFFTIKRQEYKSENEFRLIVSNPKSVENELRCHNNPNKITRSIRESLYMKTPVIMCSVDPSILISKIYVSPYAPPWYYNLIVDIMKKFDLQEKEVIQSEL